MFDLKPSWCIKCSDTLSWDPGAPPWADRPRAPRNAPWRCIWPALRLGKVPPSSPSPATNRSWDRIQRCPSEVIRRSEWPFSIQVWKNLSEIRQNCGIQDRRLWGLLDFTTYTHTHTYMYIYIYSIHHHDATKTKDGIQFKQHKYAIQHSTMILEFNQWCEISHPNKYTGLSKQVDRDILSCQTVCDWNGVHQIKTRTLVTFQKWVIQSIRNVSG